MRKIVLAAWQVALQTEMSRRLPMFSVYKKKSPGKWPRLLKYHHLLPNGVQRLIAFRPLDEEFDAYVGWAKNDRNPFENFVQLASEGQMDTFCGDAIMLPTATIARRSGATYWSFWNPPGELTNNPTLFAVEFAKYYTKVLSEEEARDLVQPSVSAAVTEIVDFCIPYLEARFPIR